MLFLLSTFLFAAPYRFETIACNSIREAVQSTPNIFLQLGIAKDFVHKLPFQKSSISFQNSDHNQTLQITVQDIDLNLVLSDLYPQHVRIKGEDGWFILNTKHALFAEHHKGLLSITSNRKELATPVSIPESGCTIETNRKFAPFLPRTEKKTIHIQPENPIVKLTLPLLSNQTEAHTLFSESSYLRSPKPLPISLSYAPLIVQLNFSPMYWMYHSAFPLQEPEYTKLFSLDPFASGTLVVFDMQHGAPELYPTLIAIPFKGFRPPKKETTDQLLTQLFAAAQFHYRKGEYGYHWREWEAVPVDGGLIISRSKSLLKEALASLEDEEPWPMLSDLQHDFFSKYLIAMHYNIGSAAQKKKIQINQQLPREISLGLTPYEDGWKLDVRSDLQGRYSLPRMIHQSWYSEAILEAPLHPIAKEMLSIAGHILAEKTPPKTYLSHQDIRKKGWIQDDGGLYSVHPTGSSAEVHYCSHPSALQPVHFTWLNGALYKNPKPCDL